MVNKYPTQHKKSFKPSNMFGYSEVVNWTFFRPNPNDYWMIHLDNVDMYVDNRKFISKKHL